MCRQSNPLHSFPAILSSILEHQDHHSFSMSMYFAILWSTHHACYIRPYNRYQQEEAQKRIRLERQQREEAEARRREKVAEEAGLRDRLIHNVQRLEQRRKEVQRELALRKRRSRSRSRSREREGRRRGERSGRRHHSSSSIVPSAIVIPRHRH